MKNTPGPWIAQKYPDVKNWTVSAKTSIASVKTGESDARLIAAAPEMYEFLKDLTRYCSETDIESFDAQKIRALELIAKAEGKNEEEDS